MEKAETFTWRKHEFSPCHLHFEDIFYHAAFKELKAEEKPRRDCRLCPPLFRYRLQLLLPDTCSGWCLQQCPRIGGLSPPFSLDTRIEIRNPATCWLSPIARFRTLVRLLAFSGTDSWVCSYFWEVRWYEVSDSVTFACLLHADPAGASVFAEPLAPGLQVACGGFLLLVVGLRWSWEQSGLLAAHCLWQTDSLMVTFFCFYRLEPVCRLSVCSGLRCLGNRKMFVSTSYFFVPC